VPIWFRLNVFPNSLVNVISNSIINVVFFNFLVTFFSILNSVFVNWLVSLVSSCIRKRIRICVHLHQKLQILQYKMVDFFFFFFCC
jgi:hypothetical protein